VGVSPMLQVRLARAHARRWRRQARWCARGWDTCSHSRNHAMRTRQARCSPPRTPSGSGTRACVPPPAKRTCTHARTRARRRPRSSARPLLRASWTGYSPFSARGARPAHRTTVRAAAAAAAAAVCVCLCVHACAELCGAVFGGVEGS
jgi:hypothetical protein